MSEKATCSKMGLISGGSQIPTESRRLKFGPFSKDSCYVIGGRMIKSVALADYRRISKKRQCRSAGLPIPAPSVVCRCSFSEQGYFLSAWKSKIVLGCPQSAFGGLLTRLNLMWTTSQTGGLKTEINNLIARRNSKLTKMP